MANKKKVFTPSTILQKTIEANTGKNKEQTKTADTPKKTWTPQNTGTKVIQTKASGGDVKKVFTPSKKSSPAKQPGSSSAVSPFLAAARGEKLSPFKSTKVFTPSTVKSATAQPFTAAARGEKLSPFKSTRFEPTATSQNPNSILSRYNEARAKGMPLELTTREKVRGAAKNLGQKYYTHVQRGQELSWLQGKGEEEWRTGKYSTREEAYEAAYKKYGKDPDSINNKWDEYYNSHQDKTLKAYNDKSEKYNANIAKEAEEKLKAVKDRAESIDRYGKLGFSENMMNREYAAEYEKQNNNRNDIEDFVYYASIGEQSKDNAINKAIGNVKNIRKDEYGLYTADKKNMAYSFEANYTDKGVSDDEKRAINMTEDEWLKYNYILGKNGKKAAEKYYKSIIPQIDRRMSIAQMQQDADFANKHKLIGAGINILASLYQAQGYAAELGTLLRDTATGQQTPINPYRPEFMPVRTVQATEEGITRDMGEKGKFITDTALSAGQSLINMPFGQAGLINMSAGAAAQGVYEKEMQGSGRGKAVAYGTAIGAIEYATEKMPFENAAKMFKNAGKTTTKKLIKDMIINAGVEASEETVSNVAGNIADIWLYQGQSEYGQYKNNLIANGMTEDEAQKEALKKFFLSDTVTAAGGGALSALMLGGLAAGTNAAENINETAQLGRDIKADGNMQRVIDEGLQRDNKTKAYKLADKLEKGQKRQSNYNIGRAATENVKAMADERRMLDSLSRNTGIENEVHDTLGDENGRYGNGKVDIARDAETSMPRTAKHEYLHAFREYAPRAYKEFQSKLFEFAKATNEEAFNKAYDRVEEKYRNYYNEKGLEYNSDIAEEELAAELTGEFLPNGAEDIEKIVKKNPQEVNRFIRSIEDAKAKIQDKLRTPFVDDRTGLQLTYSQLNDLQRLYNTALYETAEGYRNGRKALADGGVKYSQMADTDSPTFNFIDESDKSAIKSAIDKAYNLSIRNKSGVIIPESVLNRYRAIYNDPIIAIKDVLKDYYKDNYLGTSVKVNVNGSGLTVHFENDGRKKSVGWRTNDRKAATFEYLDKLLEQSVYAYSAYNRDERQASSIPHFHYFVNNVTFTDSVDGHTQTFTVPVKIHIRELAQDSRTENRYYTHNVIKNNNGSVSPSEGAQSSTIAGNAITSVENTISNPTENVKYSLKNEDGKNKATAKHYSKQLINEYGSKINSEEIVDDLDEAFHLLLNGTTNENLISAYNLFESAAEKIADNIVIVHDDLYDTYKDLRKTIRGTAISISNRDKASITGVDSFGEFRKQHFGSLNITNNGIPIDSFYQELAGQYPNFFPTDITHPADQLTRLTEVLDSLKPQEQRLSQEQRAEAKEDIIDRMFNTIGGAADNYSKKTAGRSIFDKADAQNNKQSSGVTGYTAEEAAELTKKGPTYNNYVLDKDISLKEFFSKNSRRKNNIYEKLYMGKISNNLSERINNILQKNGINESVKGKHFIITNDFIEHTKHKHSTGSNETAEKVTVDNIDILRSIIDQPDDISFGGLNENNKPVIVFKKNIDGANAVYVQFSSSNRNGLIGKTLYFDRKIKNEAASAHNGKNASVLYVQNDQSQASNANISDPNKKVKSRDQIIHRTERNGQIRVLTPAEAARATADPAKLEQKFKEEHGEGFRDAYNGQSVSRVDKEKLGKDYIIKMAHRFYTEMEDKLHPIEQYERYAEKQVYNRNRKNGSKERIRFKGKASPYVMSMNSLDAASRAKYILTEELRDFDANFVGGSLKDAINEIKNENYKEFNTYLKLRHALEWVGDEYDPEKPVFGEQLDDPLAMKEAIRQMETEHPEYKSSAQKVYEFQDNMLKSWLLDNGIIEQKDYDKLRTRYPEYVPFHRKEDTPTKRFSKDGIASQASPIKSAKGGSQPIYDPIENIALNTARYVNAVAKNSAMQAVVEIYDTVPGMEKYIQEVRKNKKTGNWEILDKNKVDQSGDETTEPENKANEDVERRISDTIREISYVKDNIVTVLQDGKKRYFKINDKDFLKAIDGMRPAQVGPIARFVAEMTRTFSTLTTSANPQFTLASNLIKDAPNAFVQTSRDNALGAIKDTLFAYIEQGANSGAYQHFAEKYGWKARGGTENYKKYIAMGGEYASALSTGRNAVKEAVRNITPPNENRAVRVIKFIPRGYNKLSDAGETAPRLGEFKYSNKNNDVHQAHFDSKKVTMNFARMGATGQKINRVIPFFNPSVQAIDQLVRNFKDRPLHTSLRVAALVIPAIITYVINHRDEEAKEAYENLSSYTKNNYYCLYKGNDEFKKIPKAQQYGMFASLIERTIEAVEAKDPDSFYGFGDYLATVLLPNGLTNKFPFIDTDDVMILGTYTSLLKNEDFKGSPIVPSYMEKLEPSAQYDENTTYAARWVGKALNWSPKQIDHAINANGGIVGSANKNILTPGKKDFTLGLRGKFIADSVYSTDVLNRFYDARDAAEIQKNTYKDDGEKRFRYNKLKNASDIISVLSGMSKDAPTPEKAREIRKLMNDYAKQNREVEFGDTDNELIKMYNVSKAGDVLTMPSVDSTIKATINKEKKEYTFEKPDGFLSYVKDLNSAVDTAYKELFASEDYKSATDEEKVKMISSAKMDAVNEIKQAYIKGNGKRYELPEAEKKALAAAEKWASEYLKPVSDAYKKAVPDASGYDVKDMQLSTDKDNTVTINGTDYKISGDVQEKVIAAAEQPFKDRVEAVFNNEMTLEEAVGKTAKGGFRYANDANGKRANMAGKLYDDNGEPRFDDVVTAKIIFKIKQKALDDAAAEFAEEITGESPAAASTQSSTGQVKFTPTASKGKKKSSGGRRSDSGGNTTVAKAPAGEVHFTSRANVADSSIHFVPKVNASNPFGSGTSTSTPFRSGVRFTPRTGLKMPTLEAKKMPSLKNRQMPKLRRL